MYLFFFFQAEDGIRDVAVTGVQTCALPICRGRRPRHGRALPGRALHARPPVPRRAPARAHEPHPRGARPARGNVPSHLGGEPKACPRPPPGRRADPGGAPAGRAARARAAGARRARAPRRPRRHPRARLRDCGGGEDARRRARPRARALRDASRGPARARRGGSGPHGRARRRGDGPDPGRAFARAAVRPLGHTEPVLRALGRSPRGARRARAARRGARFRAPRVRARGVGAIVHPRRTVVIEAVAPTVDGGRYPVKREMGAVLEVTADIFKEGHEVLVASLKYRRAAERTWRDAPMRHIDNDRWAGTLPLDSVGRWVFTIEALADPYRSWLADLAKRHAAGQGPPSQPAEGLAPIPAA